MTHARDNVLQYLNNRFGGKGFYAFMQPDHCSVKVMAYGYRRYVLFNPYQTAFIDKDKLERYIKDMGYWIVYGVDVSDAEIIIPTPLQNLQ